ncbi:HlyC/CorC family transporter [Azospirillum sp. RWY-5-1]|uniref:HlyC/CorC family transporter n=1 Tax=Azospirillum oleiclasticum TaxID=2735135 RepID=A0ABX2TA64_9PROT|nr:hemolysin family protein [Azospirillum oleiclasticum]NYZ15355.1 HlyC/CorC family transporter [Azospirillum oleiclasticum]NYZ21224.1 HlyC/CorC family transporter [Azospirillum oleiclasticum]
MLWEILIIVFLILLNAFFAMSEMALVSSRRARLQQLAEARGGKGARAALALSEDPSNFLSTVQVGITLIGIIAGAYGGATIAERLGVTLDEVAWIAPYGGQVAFVLVVAAITYLSLIVGELVPKRLALANPERISATVAAPMSVLSRAAAPLVWLLGVSTEGMLKLLGLSGIRDQTVTEEEVKTLIAEGTQSGVFEPAERQMIEGVLRLSDRSVRSIMTPRPDVVWLDLDDPQETIAREIRESGYSRFPACRGDLDEVQGIVATKALLDQALHGRPFDLRAVVVDALIVHDGTPVMRLLELFKQATVHMAVVVDEYGSVEGIVTVTDILEAIAGEMPDQGDEEQGIVRREDGSWLVDGMTPVDDVEAAIDLPALRVDDGDYHTIAGFVLDKLGHVPTASEYVDWEGFRFEVVDMDGRRIDKILIQKAGGEGA